MTVTNRVATRFRLLLAMSKEDAKSILGLPLDREPTPEEIKRAYKDKAKVFHPDRGGDPTKMVEINVAKDILEGNRRPSRSPGPTDTEPPSGGYGNVPNEPDKVVTFDDAKAAAGVPNAEWLFVTESHYSGYSSDEFTNRASGWVAVGKTDSHWVFVAVEHRDKADHFFGGGPKADEYAIHVIKLPYAPPTAQLLYGGVMKAWKSFGWLNKKFNSKVIPADGWHFQKKLPVGRSLSIKNFLLNTGMMNETDLKTPRKYTIEIHYERAPYGSDDAPHGFYKPKWGDPMRLKLIINGRDEVLSEAAMKRLESLRIGGKSFMSRVFGEYYYGGETKSLTRNRSGKAIMEWMAQNLPDIDTWAREALSAAAAQLKK